MENGTKADREKLINGLSNWLQGTPTSILHIVKDRTRKGHQKGRHSGYEKV